MLGVLVSFAIGGVCVLVGYGFGIEGVTSAIVFFDHTYHGVTVGSDSIVNC